jgi:hypothetical protein
MAAGAQRTFSLQNFVIITDHRRFNKLLFSISAGLRGILSNPAIVVMSGARFSQKPRRGNGEKTARAAAPSERPNCLDVWTGQ